MTKGSRKQVGKFVLGCLVNVSGMEGPHCILSFPSRRQAVVQNIVTDEEATVSLLDLSIITGKPDVSIDFS